MNEQNEAFMETVVSPVAGIRVPSDQPRTVGCVEWKMQNLLSCIISRAALDSKYQQHQ